MISKSKILWISILVTTFGFLYVQYVNPEPSEAYSSIDLERVYNLPAEQIEYWLSNHTEEETVQLVEKHIEKAIQNGAKPVYGEIVIEQEPEETWLERTFNLFK